MVINHNMSAMFSNRSLGVTQGSLTKDMEKLSSGQKINARETTLQDLQFLKNEISDPRIEPGFKKRSKRNQLHSDN